MNHRIEQVREYIDVVGSLGPVPAWYTQSNGHRERAVPLSLTSVMIYVGIKTQWETGEGTHRREGNVKAEAEIGAMQPQIKKCLQ